LRSQRHEAEHLFDRNLLTATDTQIWERSRLESLVIFSKDTDFYDRALLYGAPPQVVHVAVGNCSNARLFSVLASEWDEIEQFGLNESRSSRSIASLRSNRSSRCRSGFGSVFDREKGLLRKIDAAREPLLPAWLRLAHHSFKQQLVPIVPDV
jgi:predicted nuclease of predicted toxin-antitoxin system